MLLALDIGNTQTSLGFLSGGREPITWRISTEAQRTADELGITLESLLKRADLTSRELDGVVVSSVVPAMTSAWMEAVERLCACTPLVVSSELQLPFEVAHEDPTEIGADRLANVAAAQALFGVPAIVIDFGTATNIDVIDERGVYRGGTLTPGIRISNEALFSRAARLASVPLHAPENVIGSSTSEALRSGILIGAAAQVEGLVARIKVELESEDVTVIATGGLAGEVESVTDVFDHVAPDLNLHGLRILYELNNPGSCFV